MNQEARRTLTEFRQLSAVRSQCHKIYQLGLEKKLLHFSLNESQLVPVADYIFKIIKEDYPTLDIPFHSRWRHFEAGGIQRHRILEEQWAQADTMERIRRHIDLVVVSVLLDAGAGAQWSYSELESGQRHGRSEGLGIASLRMFADGKFSSDPNNRFQVDAQALSQLNLTTLKNGFQMSPVNNLLGIEGRLSLLQKLADSMKSKSDFFVGQKNPRPGHLIDWLVAQQSNKKIPLKNLWRAVIEGFEDVWPREGRIILDGCNLGDAWRHSSLGSESSDSSIVPFHKLSQWLTYSLLEPLMSNGFDVTGLEELTGLPEYRNGGLFFDFGVVALNDPKQVEKAHPVGSELIVEWRALTVVLLDKTAELIRQRLHKNQLEFPLAKVLEAGTWKAGRRIAAEKRPGGAPPIQVISDGTVF